MKLTIVTPVHTQSAIARSVSLVVGSLKNLGHSIQVISAELNPLLREKTFPFAADAVCWKETDEVKKRLTETDIVIYQLGNHYPFHAGCLALMKLYPGLIVLHDFFITNLFIGYFHHIKSTEDTLHNQLEKWYGGNITKDFFSLLSDPSFFDFASQHAPMTEHAACMAKGIISHSLWGIERVLKACGGPVACIPLSYDAPYIDSVNKHIPIQLEDTGFVSSSSNTKPGGFLRGKRFISPLNSNRNTARHPNTSRVFLRDNASIKTSVLKGERYISKTNDRRIVLTFGSLNANKRARSIINAIGKNASLKKKWLYRLVGEVTDQEKKSLQSLANKLGVMVVFTGTVSDQALAQEIMNADVVSCLRYPVLEAFSASTIEAMLYGKTIMVIDTSFYRDFPDDCIIKIPMASEINSIQMCLKNYLAQKNQYQQYGINAQKWAKKIFSPDLYAQNLIAVVKRLLVCEQARLTTENISKELFKWGVDRNSPIAQVIADAMQPVFNLLPYER